ncbi:carboxylesterase/lipase family protein [Paenibacillus sp. 2TAB23]|uniref:carboxylesterase/lipase family protein n=1 Tax=Paenibacillus sp. 2TAB23 TaxID=3233004 RepID=UPI003F9BCFC4
MIVETRHGKVRGYADNDMHVFKGIPYAKAPMGQLRFKPPVMIENWEGTWDATVNGNRAMQQCRKEGYFYSEDCLNLDIWTPAADNKKRPVIFFIQGDGLFENSSSNDFADGHRLIQGREAVLVSLNYRLGAFGYLYLGDIVGDQYAESGNCGLLDQICALQWVRNNIAAFGGDPETIILMGHSTANLMVTPRAQGMFCRAIIQSGGVQCIRDHVTATALAKYVLESCLRQSNGHTEAEWLQSMCAEELLAGQIKAYERISRGHLFGPVIDGLVIVESPESFISSDTFISVPVLIGYAKDELTPVCVDLDFKEEAVPKKLFYSYGDNSDYLFGKYLEFREQLHPSIAFGKLQTQYIYGDASISLTQLLAENGCEVWCYRWDFTGNSLPNHSSEIPYIFGISDREWEKGYRQEHTFMAAIMNKTWMTFILTGNPNHPELPNWPSCSSGEIGYRILLDEKCYVEPIHLHAYDKRFPMQVIQLSGFESAFRNEGG